jgi:hypothetical protein
LLEGKNIICVFVGIMGGSAAKKAHFSQSANLKGQTSILAFFKASTVHHEKIVSPQLKEDLAEALPQLKTRAPSGRDAASAGSQSLDSGSESGDPDIRFQ